MPGCAETQYIFDSSFELGYITSDVYDWLYNLEFNLDRLVDYSNKDITLTELQSELADAGVREVFYKDEDCEFDLQALVAQYFNRAYSSMDLVNKSYYDLSILFGSSEQPISMKHQMARRLVNCYYQDGFQKPLKIITDINELSNYDNMEFIMKHDGTISGWLFHMKNRIQESIVNLHQVDKLELRDHLQMKLEEREVRIRRYYDMINQSYERSETTNVRKSGLTYGDFSSTDKKKARKSITRAVELFGKFFNQKDIDGFIKGYEYIVEGDKFNYRLTKGDRTNILHHTLNPSSIHIPYDLEITTKNNVVLAKACYLFENTPIIDQIIAFTMMIKSGNELEFIEKANLFQKSNDYNGSDLQAIKNKNPATNDTDLICSINEVGLVMGELFDTTREKEIWINRISESCDRLFAKHLGVSDGEWARLCNVNENVGYFLSNPDSVLGLNVSSSRLLTNKAK